MQSNCERERKGNDSSKAHAANYRQNDIFGSTARSILAPVSVLIETKSSLQIILKAGTLTIWSYIQRNLLHFSESQMIHMAYNWTIWKYLNCCNKRGSGMKIGADFRESTVKKI